MLAKIKFQRSLKKGEPRYTIVGWSNILGTNELPDEYLLGRPSFFISKDISGLNEVIEVLPKTGSFKKYPRGYTFNYEEYKEFISVLKSAGQRLTGINRRNRKLTRKWTDQEFTVTI